MTVHLLDANVLIALTLRAVRAMPRCEFWPDSLSYADADLVRMRGHRQVADAYLAGLAAAHDGVLATFDRGLAQEVPDRIVLVGQSV
ncbi:hypothetical protein GCM10025872_22410 [Barrientosiimonas endolithica]|uniref:PIN domain-containing protein n=1 Tax=Barrientosiimonas endolithica TaxID=1535208 RepID=A0ABN6YNN0_9MICO|nr:hypothetical protein GCM10025872_22410 [Barrientosiimonas endolithica]